MPDAMVWSSYRWEGGRTHDFLSYKLVISVKKMKRQTQRSQRTDLDHKVISHRVGVRTGSLKGSHLLGPAMPWGGVIAQNIQEE